MDPVARSRMCGAIAKAISRRSTDHRRREAGQAPSRCCSYDAIPLVILTPFCPPAVALLKRQEKSQQPRTWISSKMFPMSMGWRWCAFLTLKRTLKRPPGCGKLSSKRPWTPAKWSCSTFRNCDSQHSLSFTHSSTKCFGTASMSRADCPSPTVPHRRVKPFWPLRDMRMRVRLHCPQSRKTESRTPMETVPTQVGIKPPCSPRRRSRQRR